MHSYAPYIDAAGAHADDFATTLSKLQDDYRSVFGADVYLGNDSQDGQWLAIQAKAISDCAAAFVAVFNAFSPSTAQGNGLSSGVKINGLARALPSSSTCDVTLIGSANTPITNGLVQDTAGNVWALPALVTIPSGGEITVTATCQSQGAIAAGAGALTKIKTPVFGWQSVTNANPATPGNPVETDAQLRVRQSESVAAPAIAVFDAIMAAINPSDVPGLTRKRGYENNLNTTDANGIPAGNVHVFAEGGSALLIAQAIASRAPPGMKMQGAITNTIITPAGSSRPISFSRPTNATIGVELTLKALAGWSTDVQPLIAKAVADYLNTLRIGGNESGKVSYFDLSVPAKLLGSPYSRTFSLTALRIKKNAGAFGSADLAIAYNEVPFADPSNVTFVIA